MFEEATAKNTVNPALSSALIAYEMAKENKAKLEDAAKQAGAEVRALEEEVIGMLLDMSEQTGSDSLSVVVNARRYAVIQKDYYSIPAGARPEAFPALREMGYDYLIQERVDDRSLTNTLNEVAEANGGALPEEFDRLSLSKYTRTTLSSRRA